MKAIYLLIFVTIFSFKSYAHPGIGIVYDGKSTIYYTDLTHVWKLNTKSGKSEIFIENIHTHELYLDKSGNLYGEHYWYIESEEKFKNYIWKANVNGEFDIIRDEQYGENLDFSFIRNDYFESFDIQKRQDFYEIIKTDSLNETILSKAELNHPTWKYLTDKEELLFVDYPSIYSFKSEELKLIAEDVSSKRFPFSTQSNEHNIYGIWNDNNDNIYVAIYGGREVKKVDKEGNIKRVLRSGFLWSPVNGVFDKDGNLWLMECKIGGKIRIRKISQSEIAKSSTFIIENVTFALIFLGLITLTYQIIKRRKTKKLRPTTYIKNSGLIT